MMSTQHFCRYFPCHVDKDNNDRSFDDSDLNLKNGAVQYRIYVKHAELRVYLEIECQ